VTLVSATSPKEVRFHLLHDKDGARIQQKRVCSADGEEVPWEHTVKGYEISKGRYVMLKRDELEKSDPVATRTIEIEDFVALEAIDPVYYQNTWYLVPDKGAAKPYALLVEAMKRTGRVGIARFVLRTKQHLCAVRPLGRALALSTMLYADEVVPQQDLEGLPDAQVKPGERELKMAEQLIGSLDAKFDIKKYKDDYRERVLELIEKKAAGEEIASSPQAPRAKVVDLMEALQKSLAAAKQGGPVRSARTTGRRTPVRRLRRRAAGRRRSG
jgi:DNA end-binding protein Ku